MTLRKLIEMQADSSTTIPEKTLVRWLFSGPHVRGLAESVGFGTQWQYELEVNKPVVPQRRGYISELDALVLVDSNPDFAIAFECKRLTVDDMVFDTEEMVGGLPRLKKGVRQANVLYQLGFHQVYLLGLIEVDSRLRSGGSWVGGGIPRSLFEKIVRFPGREKLRDEIGLIFLEIDQPVDKDVRSGGGIGLRPVRLATARRQESSLSHRIVQWRDGSRTT